MKKSLPYFILIWMMISNPVKAQMFGPQQIISNAANQAQNVFAADMNGDGHMDVLSSSLADSKIVWYQNDGLGNFPLEKVVSTAPGAVSHVIAADLDGDDDQDVIASYSEGDKVAWFENDGNGNFGPLQLFSSTADFAISVFAADLDGDEDLDILSASYYDNKIAWYKNTDGLGTFSSEKIISTNAEGAWGVYAADIDGDGDVDVLSASSDDNKVAWYKNDGSGNFGPQLIISESTTWAGTVVAADLDGDGDLDVISASTPDSQLEWYRNTDGNGNFAPKIIITYSAEWPQAVYAADIDLDGDMDVLSASSQDDRIAFYLNNGNGIFGGMQTITTSADFAKSVITADLDNDGDLDVLSASAYDDEIAWYMNQLLTISVEPGQSGHFAIYPVPAENLLNIDFADKNIQKISISDLTGKEVFTRTGLQSHESIDLSDFQSGVYIISIITGSGIKTGKIVKQ